MKNNFIKALSFICCLCLMLSVLSACGSSTEGEKIEREYLTGLATNVASGVIAENDKFSLSWDSEIANVTITDKATGYVYSQVPLDYIKENRDILKVANNSFNPENAAPDVAADERARDCRCILVGGGAHHDGVGDVRLVGVVPKPGGKGLADHHCGQRQLGDCAGHR